SDLLVTTTLSEEPRALAEKIGDEIRRTKALIASLLNFARQAPAEKNPIDLNALAQTAVTLSEPQFHDRRAKIQTEFAPNLPHISGDQNQLLQVCMHILNNALFSIDQAGGTFTVSTHHENNLAILEFADKSTFTQKTTNEVDSSQPHGEMDLGF